MVAGKNGTMLLNPGEEAALAWTGCTKYPGMI